MRINHYVAAASGLSRRAADAAIIAGRVRVEGRPAVLGQDVPSTARVQLDSDWLQLPQTHSYVMLHKPAGYVCSRAQQGSDPTIYNLLPSELQRLRPVGRLDRDSSGLLLLSDDGAFIQRYTHPSGHKTKLYEVEVDRALTPEAIARLEQGVQLADGLSRVHIITWQGRRLTLSLGEGRNRQVRRTVGGVGYSVQALRRTQVGPYQLGGLAASKWRRLTPTEATA